MLFASPIFLFLFLPLTLLAESVAPRRARNGVLLAASVAFYVWGESWYLALVATSVLVNWTFGLLIGKAQDPMLRRRWLALAIVVNLGTLAVFKYADFSQRTSTWS